MLQPALLFAIYYFIFVKILRIGFTDQLAPHGDEGKGWRNTFYLITGILPWTALAESLNRGTGVVLENANLIKKIAFPSELLPVYQVIVYHVYFLVGFGVLLALELSVNGGLPVAGRPAGTIFVRAVSGSPLCRCFRNERPHSSEWITPITAWRRPKMRWIALSLARKIEVLSDKGVLRIQCCADLRV